MRRKLAIAQKPVGNFITIGVSHPSVQPDANGFTYKSSSSYGIGSDGEVIAAGQVVIKDFCKLPVSSITQADTFMQRRGTDKVFSAGDVVAVVLDCTAQTLRLQSATVRHVIDIQPQHHQQKEWVLNVNMAGGDHQVQLI